MNFPGVFVRVGSTLAVAFALIHLSGCASTDPEFESSTARAATGAKGNEIVGKWYARSQHKGAVAGDTHTVMELYPDGTGRITAEGHIVTFMGDRHEKFPETKITSWSYAGNGVWKFRQQMAMSSVTGTFKLADGRLLKATKIIVPTAPIIGWGLMKNNEVFVRADDARAIEEESLRDNTSR